MSDTLNSVDDVGGQLIRKRYLFLILVLSTSFSFYLLEAMYIAGPEFVTWNVSSWFALFIVRLVPRITEVSFGGYLLKLERATKEAETALEQIRPLMKSMYKSSLTQLAISPVMEPSFNVVDNRAKPFWQLVESIRSAELESELIDDIKATATEIAIRQLFLINQGRSQVSIGYRELIEPEKIYPDGAMDTEPVKAYANLYELIHS
ncbi:hypothetical protein [Shewanella sp. KCT]|uniref:hypothetical protein n=1 Tax=Shewanella sp. KCT TaxID=2569535 RepID=UPI001181E173|nr:hypothetical protein [Shewanella sp. KCT]TVP15378.1 hypothetical protein AYI87_06850 [Shewanella sp. KCT]